MRNNYTSKDSEPAIKKVDEIVIKKEVKDGQTIIQHSSGSYMYDESMGKWFHRNACDACPEKIDESGNIFKDSTYRNLPESSVPQHIKNQLR